MTSIWAIQWQLKSLMQSWPEDFLQAWPAETSSVKSRVISERHSQSPWFFHEEGGKNTLKMIWSDSKNDLKWLQYVFFLISLSFSNCMGHGTCELLSEWIEAHCKLPFKMHWHDAYTCVYIHKYHIHWHSYKPYIHCYLM